MNSRTGTSPPAVQAGPSLPRLKHKQRLERFQLAILRVKEQGLKLSITAVAREAGVSPSLIHNTYPELAEEIRAQIGRGTRQQRDAKATELEDAKKQMRRLREERDAALVDLAKIASINETLRAESARLRAMAAPNVYALPQRKD